MRRIEDLTGSGRLNLQEPKPEIQIQQLQKRADRERDHGISNANVGNSTRGSKGSRNEYRENGVNGVERQAEMKQLGREKERERERERELNVAL
ncbi:hypothetical protein SLA2020_338670 [Shorea laevis]